MTAMLAHIPSSCASFHCGRGTFFDLEEEPMRGKTVLLNKSASLPARKLEVKGNIKSKKEQGILTHRKTVGKHPQKYVPKRKEDMHVSEMVSF